MKLYYFDTLNPRKVCAVARYLNSPVEFVYTNLGGYVRKYAGILDRHLSDREYLTGEKLTVADFAAAITLPYAEKAHISLAEFPNVVRWHDRLNELPAWREPFPQAQAA